MAVTSIRVKVEEIRDEVQVGNNGFSKREMVGRVEGEYPVDYLFEFPKEKARLLDTIIPGTYVTVSYNLRSNRVQSQVEGELDKFYLSLSAWRIEA